MRATAAECSGVFNQGQHARSQAQWQSHEILCHFLCSLEEEVEGRAVDASGNVYMTVDELMKQEAERRAG